MAIEAISNAILKTADTTAKSATLHTQKLAKETSTVAKATNNSQGKGQANISEDMLKDALEKANRQMKPHRTRFEFNYHEETRRVSITVIDRETSEVIREIPPEQALEMLEKLWEIAGFLVDERR